MSVPLDFFLAKYKNGIYASLLTDLGLYRITLAQQLEHIFPSLRKKQFANPLMNEFAHEDFGELLHEIDATQRLYRRLESISNDAELQKEIERSFQCDPNECRWALRVMGDKGRRALSAIELAELQMQSKLITDKEIQHIVHALRSPTSTISRIVQEAGVAPDRLASQLRRFKPIMDKVQEALIEIDIDKELEKISFVREQSPPPRYKHTHAEQMQLEAEHVKFQRGERKTAPKFSLEKGKHRAGILPDKKGVKRSIKRKRTRTRIIKRKHNKK
jgi:hypothetical protein